MSHPNGMCSFSVRSRLLPTSTIVSVTDAVKSTWLSSPEEPLNTEVVAIEEAQPSLWKAVFWGLLFSVPIWMLLVACFYQFRSGTP